MTTTTIKSATILADGIPALGKVTSEDIGHSYLDAATRAAKQAQSKVANGQADLARVFYAVKVSGIAFYGLTADEREALAADDDGRATGFSRWYQALGETMQGADKLANYGRQLAAGLPVPNVGQSRAITALETAVPAGESPDAWRDTVAATVADIYSAPRERGERVTARTIKSEASEVLGIKSAPRKVTAPSNGAEDIPAPMVETLEGFARAILSGTTDAAALDSGDLSGFSHGEWQMLTRKMAALTDAVASFKVKADRAETAPSV